MSLLSEFFDLSEAKRYTGKRLNYCRKAHLAALNANRRDGVRDKIGTLTVLRDFNSLAWRCLYCGEFVLHEMSLDHVKALNKGGVNKSDNLVPACTTCNYAKSDLDLADWLNLIGMEDSIFWARYLLVKRYVRACKTHDAALFKKVIRKRNTLFP